MHVPIVLTKTPMSRLVCVAVLLCYCYVVHADNSGLINALHEQALMAVSNSSFHGAPSSLPTADGRVQLGPGETLQVPRLVLHSRVFVLLV